MLAVVVLRATSVTAQGSGVLSQEDEQNDLGKLFLKNASLGPPPGVLIVALEPEDLECQV